MTKDKAICFVFLAVIEVMAYIFFEPVGFIRGEIGIGNAVYWLFHGNIFHLTGNLLCLWLVTTDRWLRIWEQYVVAIVICVLCSLFSGMAKPTIGLSGMVLAVIGMVLVHIWSVSNALIVAISLTLGFIMPNCNPYIHISCFVIGFLYSFVRGGGVSNLINIIKTKRNGSNKKNQGMVLQA